jgi:hypothetical protein
MLTSRTGARLEAILRDYMSRLERSSMVSPVSEVTPASGVEVKPMNLIVVTDGGERLRRTGTSGVY